MRKTWVWILTVILLIASFSVAGCDGLKKTDYKIGITQIAEHPALDAARDGFIQALKDEGFVEGENLTIDIKTAQGDIPTATTIAEGFVTDKVDLILAIATPSAQAVKNATNSIPILFTAVTDPVDAGLVQSVGSPGGNATGTHDMNPIDDQLKLIKEIVPEAKTVGVIFNSAEDNSIVQVKALEDIAPGLGLAVEKAPVTGTGEVATAAESLIDKVDAFYIPTDNTVVSAIASVIKVAEENNIPIIAGEENSVEEGALATVGIDYQKLGYQTGKMAAKILRGEAQPSELPVEGQSEYEYVVNLTAAKNMGITLPQDLLDKAKIIE